MHFLLFFVGVCSVIGGTNAASVAQTESVTQTVNVSSGCLKPTTRVLMDVQFDDRARCGFFDSPDFETPYKL